MLWAWKTYDKSVMELETPVNILCDVRDTLGLEPSQIRDGILQYTPGSENANIDISIWMTDSIVLPKWVTQAATRWVLDMWMEERDACAPGALLDIDKKFTHILRAYSMAEIIAFRNSFQRSKQVEIK